MRLIAANKNIKSLQFYSMGRKEDDDEMEEVLLETNLIEKGQKGILEFV